MLTKKESLLVAFSELDFRFEQSVPSEEEERLVGFAPDGRVGILEILEMPNESQVSLLISTNVDERTEFWSAVCVGSLAVMLKVDFSTWLGNQMRRRGVVSPWSTTKLFGEMRVSAAFYPIDTVLVTVDCGSLTRNH